MDSLTGRLLVASPQLRDPNFHRTVVLMIQHTEDGALGVVLNRPGEKTVEQVWDMIDFDPVERADPVYVGGPVPGPIIAVHTDENLADQVVGVGLYASTQNTSVDALVRQAEHPVRLYSGHSGWGGGQLEGELEAGGWLTGPVAPGDAFGDPESLWRQVTSRIGFSIMAPGVDRSRFPEDPSLN
ncbi:MAG: YqgE/AlgH family protein [Planctomycetota bacterium]